jgi:hypothetical protein
MIKRLNTISRWICKAISTWGFFVAAIIVALATMALFVSYYIKPAMPGPAPTAAPSITPVPTATATPTRVPPTPCLNLQAQYVSDVTVPDNTVVEPGATFVKTWRVHNTGPCPWPRNTALVFIGGHMSGSAVDVGSVAPGSMADVSVPMIAPLHPGVYRGDWKLSVEGQTFGQLLYIQLEVVGE